MCLNVRKGLAYIALVASKKNAKRFPLDLEPVLMDKVDGLLTFRGIKRVEGVRRIFRWFLDQPESVQQLVLGQLPDDMATDIYTLMIKRAKKQRESAEKQRRTNPVKMTDGSEEAAENPAAPRESGHDARRSTHT